jgi:hypothetical protein
MVVDGDENYRLNYDFQLRPGVSTMSKAPINPSDVKNVLGKMGLTTVPRTPGRDFVGVVEQGPSDWIGRPVFGTGGDLGFRWLRIPAQQLAFLRVGNESAILGSLRL